MKTKPTLFRKAYDEHRKGTIAKVYEEVKARFLKEGRSIHLPEEVQDDIQYEAYLELEKTPWDCVSVISHGGFERIGLGFWRKEKPNTLLFEDEETVKAFQELGELEFLRRHNEAEYEKTIRWENELLKELEAFKESRSIADEIRIKLNEVGKWLAAFAEWFLENGLEISKVGLPKREGTKKRTEYSLDELANLYAKCVEETGAESPFTARVGKKDRDFSVHLEPRF